MQWTFNAGSSATGAATLPTRSGRDDALVVATAAGSVHALSCDDGTVLWSAGFEGPVTVAAGQNPVVPQQRPISKGFLFLFCLEFMLLRRSAASRVCAGQRGQAHARDAIGQRYLCDALCNARTLVFLLISSSGIIIWSAAIPAPIVQYVAAFPHCIFVTLCPGTPPPWLRPPPRPTSAYAGAATMVTFTAFE